MTREQLRALDQLIAQKQRRVRRGLAQAPERLGGPPRPERRPGDRVLAPARRASASPLSRPG